MAKVSKVKDYMSLEEIRVRIRTAKDPDQQMRWQIIYTVAADPRKAAIVATQLGCSKWLVSSAVAEYNQLGQKAFCGQGRGRHRSRFHLSYNQEVKFLQPFVNRAIRGLIPTITQVKNAFEKRIGKTVHDSVITRLLQRHDWRKVAPRPQHVKHNDSDVELFKKNSHVWLPVPSKKEIHLTNAP